LCYFLFLGFQMSLKRSNGKKILLKNNFSYLPLPFSDRV
jgi:hypothetical protein